MGLALVGAVFFALLGAFAGRRGKPDDCRFNFTVAYVWMAAYLIIRELK